MADMVERVARALSKADGYYAPAEFHYRAARAAIAAMHKPTDDLVRVVFSVAHIQNLTVFGVAKITALDGRMVEITLPGIALAPAVLSKQVWQNMIDAALRRADG